MSEMYTTVGRVVGVVIFIGVWVLVIFYPDAARYRPLPKPGAMRTLCQAVVTVWAIWGIGVCLWPLLSRFQRRIKGGGSKGMGGSKGT
jgi:hypothetical protein